MRFYERDEAVSVVFPSLAQQPTVGFVHQVVWMVEQSRCNGEHIVEVANANKGKRRDDGNAIFPQVAAFRQPIQHIARLIQQERAQNLWRGIVNQVPVVDERCVCQIKISDFASGFCFFFG